MVTTQKKKAKLRRQADRMLQEIGRDMYNDCFVCGGEYSCLHHFISKGRSNRLRYDWENLIHICSRCHALHHQFKDSTVHAIIQRKKGDKWITDLLLKNRETVSTTLSYYKDIIEKLKAVGN